MYRAVNSVQIVLNQAFHDLKAKNPRLSNRYFARKIGISSGALSEIMKGKRKVSEKLALRIAERLQLDPKAKSALMAPKIDAEEAGQFEYLQLQDDQFHMIADWPHFAVLNLVKSSECEHKISWFAERLNLSEKAVSEVLNRLLRLGMLSYQKKKYIRTKSAFKTSDDVLNSSIQRSNLEDLDLYREHLATLPVEERDLTSITMLLDPKRMPEFKKWVRTAQDRFASKFETTGSTTAYRLTVGLFPLKKPKA
jgi:uncharacterized protein (TIGR02147 family)